PEPEMRKGGAPCRARQTSPARERGRERDLEQTRALEDFGQRAGHDVERKTDRERHQERAAAFHGEDHGDGDRGDARGADQTLSRAPRFQASSGPNGMAMRSGTNSGAKVALKNGAPTEIFSPVSASSTNG